MNDPSARMTSRLSVALESASIPETVTFAWNGRPPDPSVGQLWRARWEDVSQLLLLIEVMPRAVRAVPITLDPDEANASTVIIPEEATSLGIPLFAWIDDATSLPLRTLDRFVGRVFEASGDLSQMERGAPAATLFHESYVEHGRIQDALKVFVEARWAPEGEGNLSEILKTLPARKLEEVLQLPPQQVLALRRGTRSLSPAEAERVAPYLDMPVDSLLRGNPRLPEELIADLDLPRFRCQVRRIADQKGVAETDAWVEAGYAVLAPAYRQTQGAALAWEERLQQYFDAVLDA